MDAEYVWTLYEKYVCWYLSMNYPRDESEFYASIMVEIYTDDLCETPMLQSMVQNVSDEEDNTWGNWTAQGKLQQAPSQAPTACLRRAESDSQENPKRIARRIQVLLKSSYKCVSQARCQAEAMIGSKPWLTKIELDKIKEKCKDECCNPASSSAIHGSTNTTISEAATEHSVIRQLLKSTREAATEHSEIPEAACLDTKRPRKSGKGSFSQKMSYPGTNAKTTSFSQTQKMLYPGNKGRIRRLLHPADEIPFATTVPTPTLLPSNDEQEPAPAPPPEQAPNAADAVCTAATRKRTDSESPLTDDDYESWLQSHGYST